ncbi:MAG: hypothetical protein A2X86_20830 [Bdellovibrionales bacterium GWA2_49_15]|nr:MAG: hypothetical protein A2X86_20830 [Bdellovibrionales bacterium GWA2_49_15]
MAIMSTSALFIGENKNAAAVFSLLLERDFGLDCVSAVNSKHAIELLKNEPHAFGLCIFLLPATGVKEFLEVLKTLPRQIPVMLTADDAHLNHCTQFLPYHPLAAKIAYSVDWQIISTAITRLLRVVDRKERKLAPFCALDANLFLRLEESPYDLYLKLSDDKMVLVFRRGTNILSDDTEKYQLKNHPHFYLKAQDYLQALELFLNKIKETLKAETPLHNDKLSSIAMFTHQNMRQMIQRLGLSDTAIEMANSSIRSIHKMLNSNDKIAEHFTKFLTKKNYLSEHCLAIPFVVAGMATTITSFPAVDLEKITFASMFHDIGLEDLEMAQVRHINDQVERNWGSAKLSVIKQHPYASVELIKKLSGVPADSEKIILQHHERPDGSGFPHGVDYKKISPLSAMFIVAEEFVSSVYDSGLDKMNVDAVMDDLALIFHKGNFLMAFKALQTAVGHGPLQLIKGQ